jgi:hypothetical protein
MMSWRIALIICLAACGCNKSPGPPRVQSVPINGTVKLDGKPIAGVDVLFLSQSPPAAFSGRTNDAGVYELQGIKGDNTDLQGMYKVTISRMAKPDGTPLGPDEAPMKVGAVEQLPAKYARSDLTTLSANVPASGGTFDFELASK